MPQYRHTLAHAPPSCCPLTSSMMRFILLAWWYHCPTVQRPLVRKSRALWKGLNRAVGSRGVARRGGGVAGS